MTNKKDYFGADAAELMQKRLFLFDMDGTIYNEELVFEGTLELLDTVRSLGGKYVFITNNSSKSVDDYIDKLKRLGIPVDYSNFFTSTQATIAYLQENFPKTKVYCQGTRSMVLELAHSGIDVVEEVQSDAQVVLVGFDTELTSRKLQNTCEMLYKPIPYIATNPDLACPVRIGFIPDCGSICQMLENATGRRPVYIGKPQAVMVDIVRKKFGYTREQTVVIGDRLYTDIAAGLNAGVMAVCVLTGEATISSIQKSRFKPTLTFESVLQINECLAFRHN